MHYLQRIISGVAYVTQFGIFYGKTLRSLMNTDRPGSCLWGVQEMNFTLLPLYETRKVQLSNIHYHFQ